MKHLLIFIYCLLFLCILSFTGCGGGSVSRDPVAEAERSFADGQYERAQMLCDSLLQGPEFERLDVDRLCRLSLLFMRLAENSADNDANMALATRALDAALERDADSTLLVLNNVPVEEKARVAILTAIHEAQNAPMLPDTVTYDF